MKLKLLEHINIIKKIILLVFILILFTNIIYADKIYKTITVGQQYKRGDNVTISVALENSTGSPVNGERITAVVYYPNNTILSTIILTNITNGLYTNTTTIPSDAAYGDYVARVSSNTFLGFAMFQVKQIEALASSINQTSSDLNTTAATILANIDSVTRLIISDFDEVSAGHQYRVKATIIDFLNLPKDPLVTPTVTLLDPLQNTIVDHVSMSKLSTGLYEYNFTTSASQTDGVWEAIINATTSKASLSLSDYWELESSPAEVVINSITDNTVETITADVTITNEGSGAQEYQIEYCIVAEQTNACGGGDDVDYGTSAKLIQPGESYNPQLTLNVETVGDYYFKVVVYFGTESSGASKSFTAVIETITTAPTVTPGESGAGTESEIVRENITRLKSGEIEFVGELPFNFLHRIMDKNSGIAFTIQNTDQRHSAVVKDFDRFENYVLLEISSQPFVVKMKIDEKRMFDLTNDGIMDIEVYTRIITDDGVIIGFRQLGSNLITVKEPSQNMLINKILEYPLLIQLSKTEPIEKTLEIKNIGKGKLSNVHLEVSGLPSDAFRIIPKNYDKIDSDEEGEFTIVFEPKTEEGINTIKFIVIADEDNEDIGAVYVLETKANYLLFFIIIAVLLAFLMLRKTQNVEEETEDYLINKFRNPLIIFVLIITVIVIGNVTPQELVSKSTLTPISGVLGTSISSYFTLTLILIVFILLIYTINLIKNLNREENNYNPENYIQPKPIYKLQDRPIELTKNNFTKEVQQTIPQLKLTTPKLTDTDYKVKVDQMFKEQHYINLKNTLHPVEQAQNDSKAIILNKEKLRDDYEAWPEISPLQNETNSQIETPKTTTTGYGTTNSAKQIIKKEDLLKKLTEVHQ